MYYQKAAYIVLYRVKMEKQVKKDRLPIVDEK
jgi:hypothetical protein